jgi:hypothetical protein
VHDLHYSLVETGAQTDATNPTACSEVKQSKSIVCRVWWGRRSGCRRRGHRPGGEGQGAVSKGVIVGGAVVNARGRGHNCVQDD